MHSLITHFTETKAVDYKVLKVNSPAFKNEGMIPAEYTCDGRNVNPPLDILDIPKQTKCLAIIVEDPDAPIRPWTHWLVWNIPITHHIKENRVNGIEGINDFQEYTYGGPCPPSGTHRYFFKVYALDEQLELPRNTSKIQLEKAMSAHIIGFGETIGLYHKKNS